MNVILWVFVIFQADEVAVFIHQALRAFLEGLLVFRGPPVAQVALGIELAALVVKAVSKFVSNDGADAAEVNSIVEFVVVERRLQNSGGEVDVVFQRIVVSVDRGWSHPPFRLVHVFADLAELTPEFKGISALLVPESVPTDNFDQAVVTVLVGIANLIGDGFQLDQCCLLGGVCHPG